MVKIGIVMDKMGIEGWYLVISLVVVLLCVRMMISDVWIFFVYCIVDEVKFFNGFMGSGIDFMIFLKMVE